MEVLQVINIMVLILICHQIDPMVLVKFYHGFYLRLSSFYYASSVWFLKMNMLLNSFFSFVSAS